MDKLIFSNGDTIELNIKGNTYIGESAHVAMNCYYKMIRENKLIDSFKIQKSFYKELVKLGVVNYN